jgi:hypothetical protein
VTLITVVRRQRYVLAAATHVQKAWLHIGRAMHLRGGLAQLPKIAKQDHLGISTSMVSQSIGFDEAWREMYHSNPRSAKEMVFDPATIKWSSVLMSTRTAPA